MSGVGTDPVVITRGVRNDTRCGSEFPLEDGSPSKCDPDSAIFCCSSAGYCGNTEAHCSCPKCKNYNPSRGE